MLLYLEHFGRGDEGREGGGERGGEAAAVDERAPGRHQPDHLRHPLA